MFVLYLSIAQVNTPPFGLLVLIRQGSCACGEQNIGMVGGYRQGSRRILADRLLALSGCVHRKRFSSVISTCCRCEKPLEPQCRAAPPQTECESFRRSSRGLAGPTRRGRAGARILLPEGRMKTRASTTCWRCCRAQWPWCCQRGAWPKLEWCTSTLSPTRAKKMTLMKTATTTATTTS